MTPRTDDLVVFNMSRRRFVQGASVGGLVLALGPRAASAQEASISGSTSWPSKRGVNQTRFSGRLPSREKASDARSSGCGLPIASNTRARSATVRAIGPMTSQSSRITGRP